MLCSRRPRQWVAGGFGSWHIRRPQERGPGRQRTRICPCRVPGTITSRDILVVLIANAVIIVGMWVRHGGLAQLDTPAGIATAPARSPRSWAPTSPWCSWCSCPAAPGWSGCSGSRPAGGLASMGGLRVPVAARRACGVHDGGLRHERRQRRRGRDRHAPVHLSLGAHGHRGPGAAHRGGGHLHPRRAPPPVLRDLVSASTCTRTWASRSPSCTSWSWAPTSSTTQWRWATGWPSTSSPSGCSLTFRVIQPIVFSMRHRLRVERVVQEAPGVVSIHLTGERHGRAAHPRRPVLPVPVPDRRRLVAPPSVLHLGRAQRHLAATHGQGPGRRHAVGWRSSSPAPASSPRDRTAPSPESVMRRHARRCSSRAASASRRCAP